MSSGSRHCSATIAIAAAAVAGFALLAWACFALGLCSTEAAIGAAGYLLAYALCFEPGRLRTRCASLLPYAAIAASWVWIRHAAHYGVVGLGGYVDPIEAPLAFVSMLPQRTLMLLSGQVVRLCADLFDSAPLALQPAMLLGAALCLGLALWAAWPALRHDRQARFWATGALLSALPLTAAVPSDRLLTPVGLGAIACVAHLLRDAFEASQPLARTAAAWAVAMRRDVALGLVCIHFLIDPLLLPWLAMAPSALARTTHALDASLPNGADLQHQTVIVATIPDSWMLSYLPVMRSILGEPRPDKLHWLLATQERARFERRGPNVLRVRSEHGFFDRHWFERSSLIPLRAGETVELSQMSVTVREVTSDGRPLVCDFVFSQPLESPSYLWLTFRDGRLEPFRIPVAGEHTTLPGAS